MWVILILYVKGQWNLLKIECAKSETSSLKCKHATLTICGVLNLLIDIKMIAGHHTRLY